MELARKATLDMIDFELHRNRVGKEPKSALNKVMFVSALDPWALLRQEAMDGDLLELGRAGAV